MASPEISCPEIDNTFQLYAEHCRDGFDFTLIFEQTIFGLLPLGLLLLISPFRILHLLPQCKKVYQSLLLSFKIVGFPSFFRPHQNGIRTSRRMITILIPFISMSSGNPIVSRGYTNAPAGALDFSIL